MAGKTGLLVLSHQLLSMVEPIAEALRRRGITAYVLASRPTRAVTAGWADGVGQLHVTEGYALTHEDVDLHLKTLEADGVRLLGCLTVWDAYRELMAYANRRTGTADLPEETVRLLRDKLAMRTRLREAGLSRVAAWPFDPERFDSLADKSRYFIKPCAGLASLGAFPADRLGTAGELDTLWQRARDDRAYAGVFQGEPAFLIEEFIDGTECSFEVTVASGRPEVHAVHEKVDLRRHGRTTLENACVCPPVSVGRSEVEDGIAYVTRCLAALGADTGAYHVEARFSAGRGWELVEANPRIGGACIVSSTRRHSGVDLLDRWAGLLLGEPAPSAAAAPDGRPSTFFRVFFGEPGRRIGALRLREDDPAVLEQKVFVREGDLLPLVDREIFLGQTLWDTTGVAPEALADFIRETETHLGVEYSR